MTVTQLADTLARDHGVPFKAGHAIASKLIAARTARPAVPLADLLAGVSREVTGREIKMSADVLANVLSPEHFIAVRKTPGGPAPEVTAAALAAARRRLADDSVDVTRRREGLTSADVRRRQAVEAL